MKFYIFVVIETPFDLFYTKKSLEKLFFLVSGRLVLCYISELPTQIPVCQGWRNIFLPKSQKLVSWKEFQLRAVKLRLPKRKYLGGKFCQPCRSLAVDCL